MAVDSVGSQFDQAERTNRSDSGFSSPKGESSSSGKGILGMYDESRFAKNEKVKDAPKNTNGFSNPGGDAIKDADKAKLEELKSKVKEREGSLVELNNTEAIVNKKEFTYPTALADSLIDWMTEASNQLTRYGANASILEDKDALKMIFNISISPADKEDSDSVRVKNKAIGFMKEYASTANRKDIPADIASLLFANNAEAFMKELKEIVNSPDGLAKLARSSDGGVGSKVTKMARAFGELQQTAATALMMKAEQLLTGSPDRDLIKELTSDERRALYSLRTAIARDFNTTSSTAISDKMAEADSIEGQTEKDALLANIARVTDLRSAINELFTAENEASHKQAARLITEHVLTSHSNRFAVESTLASLDKSEAAIKKIQKATNSDPRRIDINAAHVLLMGSEAKVEFLRDLKANAQAYAKGKTSIQEKDITNAQVLEELKAYAQSKSEKIFDTEITKDQLSAIIVKVEKAPGGIPHFNKGTEKELSSKYQAIVAAIKADLVKNSNTEAKEAKDLYSQLQTILNDKNNNFIFAGDSSAAVVASLDSSKETTLNALVEGLIKAQGVGTWSLTLSNDAANETKLEKLVEFIGQAKEQNKEAGRAVSAYENLEYQLLFRPLGKKAETVAAAIRNTLMEFYAGTKEDAPDTSGRYFEAMNASVRHKELNYQKSRVRSLSDFIHNGGQEAYIDKEVKNLAASLGTAEATLFSGKDGFVSNVQRVLREITESTDNKVKIYASSFKFDSSEQKIMNKLAEAESDTSKARVARAEILATVVRKLNTLNSNEKLKEILQTKIGKSSDLVKVISALETKEEEIRSSVQKLERAKDTRKAIEDELKEARKELKAWENDRSSNAVFATNQGGSFVKRAVAYFHSIVTRLFAHTDEATTKDALDNLTARIKNNSKDLNPSDNALDEAVLAGLNTASSLEFAKAGKIKDGAKDIAAYSSSAKKEA